MKKLLIIGTVVIAALTVGVVLLNLSSSHYVNFTEARESAREVHVGGFLVNTKPVEYNPEIDPNTFSFYMKDRTGQEQRVIVNKALPDGFEQSSGLTVIGSMNGNNFVAADILIKCAGSRYNVAQQ